MGEFQAGPRRGSRDRPASRSPNRWILSRPESHPWVRCRPRSRVFRSATAGERRIYQFPLGAKLCDWFIELSKGPLIGRKNRPGRKRRTRRYAGVLSRERLMRPFATRFMPFHHRRDLATRFGRSRGEDRVDHEFAKYPESDRRLDDPAAEAEEMRAGHRSDRGHSNDPRRGATWLR